MSRVSSNVVLRRKPDQQEDDRPMSMAERMSMFNNGSSGGGHTNGSAGNGAGPPRQSWKSAPAPVKLADNDESPARPAMKVTQAGKDNRQTMPPNMYTPSQVQAQPAAQPAHVKAGLAAMSGRSKLKSAIGGMMAAIDTEKQHKGIQKKDAGGFMGLINTVAPKNPVKRATSTPTTAQQKKQALIQWCQRMTADKDNVDITNFSKSWNDGMAFCALFHHFVPDGIPYETLDPKNREFNFHLAFTEGEKAGVTALLDVEDCVEMKNPDWMSVMTYISLIYNHFNGIRVGGPKLPDLDES